MYVYIRRISYKNAEKLGNEQMRRDSINLEIHLEKDARAYCRVPDERAARKSVAMWHVVTYFYYIARLLISLLATTFLFYILRLFIFISHSLEKPSAYPWISECHGVGSVLQTLERELIKQMSL